MGVEAGGDENQIRREGVHPLHQSLERAPPHRARRVRRHRGVDDIAHAGLRRRAGARVARALMHRGEENVGIGLDHRLGAVAVMHVEIGDGDSFDA